MKLPRSVVTSLPLALEREWLVTNGIGGFASGTVSQANTRRYHGILVASLQPPVDRVVLVSKLDVSATYRGRLFKLACNEFADGTIEPRGYQLISGFRLDEQIPTWTYSFDDAVLEQRIWMAHGRNTTYVSFQLWHAVEPLDLELIPLCTYRDYHAHSRGGWHLDVTPVKRGCQITAFNGGPAYRIVMDSGEFRAQPDWYWHFRHRAESERGLDDVEDLLAPGSFAVRVAAGEAVTVIATAEQNEPDDAGSVAVRGSNRRATLLQGVPERAPEWIRQLTLAADQFVVSRGNAMLPASANIGASVIAGYPWFSDWGRDTMIALPGLCIATGRATQAATVLRTFAKHISQGMLPNRFPDAGTAPEYNTVDATLWYFHAIATYLDATRDYSLLKDLFGTLKEVIEWHLRGTRYAIGADPEDGLLSAGQPNTQLTWMDARVDGHAVTARVGKPVEVNALWHFALASMAEWATVLNDSPAAAEFDRAARKAAASFATRFWNASAGCLYDVIDGPEDPTTIHGRHVDATVRPNQIFAVSLGKSLLSTEQARAVVDICTRNLLTPVGLRSLSPNDARYAGLYQGGPATRDASYHQGTVWSWLLGAYVIAHYRTYGDHQHASALLEGIAAHLGDACLGTVSEIFDGDAPHQPRGAFAQAWSVGEILRAWHFLRAQQ